MMGKSFEDLTLRKELALFLVLGLILVNIMGTAIYWCYMLVPIFILRFFPKQIVLDKQIVLITAFSILYPFCLQINEISIDQISSSVYYGYAVLPPLFYLLGKQLVHKYPHKNTVIFFIFFICIVFSILPFLSNLIAAIRFGFMTNRNISLLWQSSDQGRAATNIGSYFAISAALLPLVFLKKTSKVERVLGLLSLILFLMAVFSNLNMSNRTWLVIFGLSLVTGIILDRLNFRTISLITVVSLILMYFYNHSAYNIDKWLDASQFYLRLSNTSFNEDGSRLLIWNNALREIFDYPFGNATHNIGASYAHNLWLDVGRKAGVLPLVPLLLFTLLFVSRTSRLILDRDYSVFFRMLIASVSIAFLVTFIFEPIMEGFFIMFLVFCFFVGIIIGAVNYLDNSVILSFGESSSE